MNRETGFDGKKASLAKALDLAGPRIVACSGGLDSLVLAAFAHRLLPEGTFVVHAEGPSVPREARERLMSCARAEGWRLECVEAGENRDEDYLRNPRERCYFCKKHLYAALSARKLPVLSGANVNDLAEYRPGLLAAEEFGVRHPFVEAGMGKKDIRVLARDLGLPYADIPASPCLASRFYTGTPIRTELLRMADDVEMRIKKSTGIRVVRCRFRGDEAWIELGEGERHLFTEECLRRLRDETLPEYPAVRCIELDPEPYRAGRSFEVGV